MDFSLRPCRGAAQDRTSSRQPAAGHHRGYGHHQVRAIVAGLEAAGYPTRTRVGRRNRYTIDPTVARRHPAEADHPVGDLLDTFLHREKDPAPISPEHQEAS